MQYKIQEIQPIAMKWEGYVWKRSKLMIIIAATVNFLPFYMIDSNIMGSQLTEEPVLTFELNITKTSWDWGNSIFTI